MHVGEASKDNLASRSRHCLKTLTYAAPENSVSAFLEDLSLYVRNNDIEVVLPMSDLTTHVLLGNRDKLPPLRLPCADLNSYEQVSDKKQLLALAENLGIPAPRSVSYDPAVDAIDPGQLPFSYPVVLKPAHSCIPVNDGYLRTTVKIAHSPDEFNKLRKQYDWFERLPFLVQEFVPGYGQGVFAFFSEGLPRALFAHRRIREKPPSGGVSVLSESIDVDPVLEKMSIELLESVAWDGAAMVEFRITPDGNPFLMEINGRFWGSLALAVKCGVDFPLMAYRLACGEKIEPQNKYQVGIRNRWLLGDLDHLYLLCRDSSPDIRFVDKAMAVVRFLNLFPRKTHYEVLTLDDLSPFIFELRRYLTPR